MGRTKERIKRLEMVVRGLSPRWLRQVYRAARAIEPVPMSRGLPSHLIKDCRFCADRVAMLNALPHGGAVAEIGTYRGDFARRIVTQCRPRELHLIDIDYSHFDPTGLAGPEVRIHRGLSHEVIASFPDDYFDWIYVDAEHSYPSVLRDARAAAPKVRRGGFLVFNDFAHVDPRFGRYGVHRAVTDFTVEAGWSLRYFTYDGAALYDVALARP
jgi:hypothetical protein